MFHQAVSVNAAAQRFLWDLLPSSSRPPLSLSLSRLRGSDLLRPATAAPSAKTQMSGVVTQRLSAVIKFQYAAGCSISQLSRALI